MQLGSVSRPGRPVGRLAAGESPLIATGRAAVLTIAVLAIAVLTRWLTWLLTLAGSLTLAKTSSRIRFVGVTKRGERSSRAHPNNCGSQTCDEEQLR